MRLIPIGRDVLGRFRALTQVERRAVTGAMRAQAESVKRDYEKTVATWKHKPKFTITMQDNGTRFTVGTTDEIYLFVNKGTRPHVIRARNAKVLAFKSGFTAKTQPRVIGSGAGGSSGENVYRAQVNHPGTQAREFDEVIRNEAQRTLANNVQRAITLGAKSLGLTNG